MSIQYPGTRAGNLKHPEFPQNLFVSDSTVRADDDQASSQELETRGIRRLVVGLAYRLKSSWCGRGQLQKSPLTS